MRELLGCAGWDLVGRCWRLKWATEGVKERMLSSCLRMCVCMCVCVRVCVCLCMYIEHACKHLCVSAGVSVHLLKIEVQDSSCIFICRQKYSLKRSAIVSCGQLMEVVTEDVESCAILPAHKHLCWPSSCFFSCWSTHRVSSHVGHHRAFSHVGLLIYLTCFP